MHIKDAFFEKGHFWLKLRQAFVGILMWLALFAPVAITLNSVYLRFDFLPRWQYLEGFHLYELLAIILLEAVVLATALSVFLTLRNNRFISKHVKKEILYDEESVAKKLAIVEQVHVERFGNLEARHEARTYSVKEAQNFDDDFFQKLYLY